jgi:DNA-binding transcriptional regulator YdaS (Cro superfamily)
MDIRTYYDALPHGGRLALARALSISKHYLYQMVTNRRAFSPTRCLAIQAATNGAVSVHELRPDIFGNAPDDPPAERHREAHRTTPAPVCGCAAS